MTTNNQKLSKKELQIYILLLCANADSEETEAELDFIKSKVDIETYERVYKSFSDVNEDERLEVIENNIHLHEFTEMELGELRREIYEIFFSDCDFQMMERNLDRILDNILY